MASHFQPRAPSRTGSAMKRSSARPTSTAVKVTHFRSTQPRTTKADTARSRPVPVGRLMTAKVNRLLAAPPVNTQP